MTLTTQDRKYNPTAKILITEACLAKASGEPALRHCDLGEEFAADRDVAVACVYAGKAVFLDAADDFNRYGGNTVTAAVRARVASSLRLMSERAEVRAAQAGR